MVRLILIAVAIFLAIYLLSRRFNAGQKGNDGEEEVVSPRSGGFLIAVIAVVAVLSLIFILPRLGISLGGLIQKLNPFRCISTHLRFHHQIFLQVAVSDSLVRCGSKASKIYV